MRPLRAEYTFIWVDTPYEKVRRNNRVVSSAVMIAHGIDLNGQRKVLAVEPIREDSENSWR
ncbi:MAG: transposase [Candidatus Aminicenantes bacterium]|nr:transposase [Candidatus Aminicenantes bacterium]